MTKTDTHLESSAQNVEEVARKSPETVWGEPLTIPADYWLKGRRAPRFLMGKWIVELIGPAPTEGRWENEAQNRWRWTVSKKDGPFFSPNGNWFFTGRQPEFDSQNLIWQFISDQPELFWQEGEKKIASRFGCDAQNRLVIATDSQAALALFPKIEQSLEFQFKISTSSAKADGSDYFIQQDAASGRGWSGGQSSEVTRRPTADLRVRAEDGAELNAEFSDDETPADWNLDYDVGASVRIHPKAGQEQPATFKDLFDDRIVLETPWSGSAGERVSITIRTENTTPQLNFRLNGKVDLAEKFHEDTFSLTLVLEDHANPLLEQFNKLVTSRQNSILGFFKAAKGA